MSKSSTLPPKPLNKGWCGNKMIHTFLLMLALLMFVGAEAFAGNWRIKILDPSGNSITTGLTNFSSWGTTTNFTGGNPYYSGGYWNFSVSNSGSGSTTVWPIIAGYSFIGVVGDRDQDLSFTIRTHTVSGTCVGLPASPGTVTLQAFRTGGAYYNSGASFNATTSLGVTTYATNFQDSVDVMISPVSVAGYYAPSVTSTIHNANVTGLNLNFTAGVSLSGRVNEDGTDNGFAVVFLGRRADGKWREISRMYTDAASGNNYLFTKATDATYNGYRVRVVNSRSDATVHEYTNGNGLRRSATYTSGSYQGGTDLNFSVSNITWDWWGMGNYNNRIAEAFMVDPTGWSISNLLIASVDDGDPNNEVTSATTEDDGWYRLQYYWQSGDAIMLSPQSTEYGYLAVQLNGTSYTPATPVLPFTTTGGAALVKVTGTIAPLLAPPLMPASPDALYSNIAVKITSYNTATPSSDVPFTYAITASDGTYSAFVEPSKTYRVYVDSVKKTGLIFSRSGNTYQEISSGTAGAAFATVYASYVAPGKPVLSTPIKNSMKAPLTPTLTWSDTSGRASKFYVEIYSDSLVTLVKRDSVSAPTVLYTMSTGLVASQKYYWRVGGWNSGSPSVPGYYSGSTWSDAFNFTTQLAVPLLDSPADNAQNTVINPSLVFHNGSSAPVYSFRTQVDTFSDFHSATMTYNQSNLYTDGTESVSLAGLKNGKIYYWRVSAIKNAPASDTSDWSEVRSFTTVVASPTAPILIAPSLWEQRVSTSPTFAWQDPSPSFGKAQKYRIQVMDSTVAAGLNGNDNALWRANSTINVEISTPTEFYDVISSLKASTKYYWRVGSWNPGVSPITDTIWSQTAPYTGSGTRSNYYWTFTTGIAVPVLSTPANTSAAIPYTPTSTSIVWLRPEGTTITGYRYQVSADNAFATKLYDNIASGAGTLSATITLPTDGTNYFWRVNTQVPGDSSAWSTPYQFTTKLRNVGLIAPARWAQTSTSPVLSWDAINGATSYRLVVADSTSPTTATTVYDMIVTGKASQQVTLLNNHTYFWQVKGKSAKDSSNSFGSDPIITNSYSFKVTQSIPILISPANDAVGVPVTVGSIMWNRVVNPENVASYRYQIAYDNSFNQIVQSGLVTAGLALNDTTASYTLPNWGTDYYWRVNAILKNNDTSGWSATWHFTSKLQAPVVISPINNQTVSTTPNLIWNNVTGAASYRVEVYEVGVTALKAADKANAFTGGWGTLVAASPYGSYITATEWTTPVLKNSKKHIWVVKAFNGLNASSTDSSAWSFDTYPLPVNPEPSFTTQSEIPILVAPTNGNNAVSINPVFKWRQSLNANKYLLQVATNSTFTALIYNDSSFSTKITDTQKTISGLSIKTTYYWRVAAKKTSVTPWTAWSEVWSFRTGGAQISIDPDRKTWDSTIITRTKTQNFTITNSGFENLLVYSLKIVGANADQFEAPALSSFQTVAPNGTPYVFQVSYKPTTRGAHTAVLQIYHNDPTLETLSIPLNGIAVPTMAKVNFPSTIDFKDLYLLSDPKDTTIYVTNQSYEEGDFLQISDITFSKSDIIFTQRSNLPMYVGPRETKGLTFRCDPKTTGSVDNEMTIVNTSLNSQNAKVTVKAKVNPTWLTVSKNPWDFGNTSKDTAFKVDTVYIYNSHPSLTITVNSKTLANNTTDFTILKGLGNSAIAPGQKDTIVGKFFPLSKGRKEATFVILSNDPLSGKINLPLVGSGSEYPVLAYNPTEVINFGTVNGGTVRDTIITIWNNGSSVLNITNKAITGTNKSSFTIVKGASDRSLVYGDIDTVKIRVTGQMPVGSLAAAFTFSSNDPDKATSTISLIGSVSANQLCKSASSLNFDTVAVGYYKDSTLVLTNCGNVALKVTRITVDGPFWSDFTFVDSTILKALPFTLSPNSANQISLKVRFMPGAPGNRYARLVLVTDDMLTSFQSVALTGVGLGANPILAYSPKTIDFGDIPILETKIKYDTLYNLSKFAKLKITSLSIADIENQPFILGNVTLPITIDQGGKYILQITYNPKAKQLTYSTTLNLASTDTTQKTVAIPVTGGVINPNIVFDVNPVFKFGKVVKGSSKAMTFVIRNSGSSYLSISNIALAGGDADEFTVKQKTYPVQIERGKWDSLTITYNAARVGSADARVVFTTNDVFFSGTIDLWAECIASGTQTGIARIGEIPSVYSVSQNYPNPFNPSTKIRFGLPEASRVKIKIYNTIGQEVQTLMEGEQQAGLYELDWHASNLPSGVYFYRLEASSVNGNKNYKDIKKMMFLK